MLYSWICSCNILVAEGRRDGAESPGSRAEDKGRGTQTPYVIQKVPSRFGSLIFKQKIDSCEIKSLFTF